jgi:hypothetical protein
VAIKRAITLIIGTRFNKKKNKQIATLVITILLIFIVGNYIHDPMSRRLIDEENNGDDVRRTWCTVSYSYSLQIYNYIIHLCHCFDPFIINLISAVILIIKKSAQQAIVHKKRSYQKILRDQIEQHKQLLTALTVLIILAYHV